MKDLLSINRPTDNCGKPVMKLEAYSDCQEDNFTNNYYGNGDIIDRSDGFGGTIQFSKSTNIHVSISRIPRKIERTVSYFCRTQKVRSSKTWDIQGMDMYPAWKMDEIEGMLQAETIVADGQEVVYRGGDPAFTQIVNGCTGRFKMRLTFEECAKQQIYGCNSDCVKKDKYINVTDGIFNTDLSMATFYDSNKVKIASSYDGFKAWLRNQDGVTDVQEVDNSDMKCASYKVLKISGGDALSAIYYAVKTNPNNKIYIRAVEGINELCNGQDSTLCATPILGIPELYEITCDAVVYGTPELYYMGQECEIIPMNGWVQGSGETSVKAGIDSTKVSLSLTNPNFIGNSGGQQTLIFNELNNSATPMCTVTLPSGIGATINEVKINNVVLSSGSYTFDDITGKVTIVDEGNCAQNEQYFYVSYDVISGNSPYVMSGQTIAKIQGGCLPLNNVYFTNSCNGSIPDDVTIVIQPNGEIKWWGQVNYSDNNGSKIDVTNLIF